MDVRGSLVTQSGQLQGNGHPGGVGEAAQAVGVPSLAFSMGIVRTGVSSHGSVHSYGVDSDQCVADPSPTM